MDAFNKKGFTRREIMERCVDAFGDFMHEARREGPERNKTRHQCLGTLLKPLGYLSSGAKVSIYYGLYTFDGTTLLPKPTNVVCCSSIIAICT